MENLITLNSGEEFIEYLSSNPELRSDLVKTFAAPVENMHSMKESLKHRPCSCGGVNPDAVIAQRRANLEKFYGNWIKSLNDSQIENLKSILDKGRVTLTLSGQTIY